MASAAYTSAWKKAALPSLALTPDSSVPLCKSLVPFQLLPQHWSSESESTPEPVGSPQEHYNNLCMENPRKLIFLYCIYSKEWMKKLKRVEGITLNIAGNNHLMPMERGTGEDFWTLLRTLEKNCMLDITP